MEDTPSRDFFERPLTDREKTLIHSKIDVCEKEILGLRTVLERDEKAAVKRNSTKLYSVELTVQALGNTVAVALAGPFESLLEAVQIAEGARSNPFKSSLKNELVIAHAEREWAEDFPISGANLISHSKAAGRIELVPLY